MQRSRSRPSKPLSLRPSTVTKETEAILQDFRLHNVPSHLMRRAHFKAEELFAKAFPDEFVTPRQKAALVLLYQNPGLNQNTLSEYLVMDRNTVTEMIRRMISSELIERKRSSTDARSYQLFVAPAGMALLNRVMPLDASVEDALLAPLPEEYRDIFVKCLHLIAKDGAKVVTSQESTKS